MINRQSVDFKTISVPFRALAVKVIVMRLWRHGVKRDCDIIADLNNGWGECIVPIEIFLFNCDPFAAFSFRAHRGLDPIPFEIMGWTAKERTGSYPDTLLKTIALTTIIVIYLA